MIPRNPENIFIGKIRLQYIDLHSRVNSNAILLNLPRSNNEKRGASEEICYSLQMAQLIVAIDIVVFVMLILILFLTYSKLNFNKFHTIMNYIRRV
jgi:hypothetical protein